MEFDERKKRYISRWIIGIASVCILIYLGVQNIGSVATSVSWVMNIITPLIMGFFFALILNVPVRFFETHLFRKSKKKIAIKLRRPLAILLSIILILGILTGVVCLIIPELSDAVRIIVNGAIEMLDKVDELNSPETFKDIPFGDFLYNNLFSTITIDWDSIISSLEEWVKTQGSNIVNTAVVTISSVVDVIVDLIIATIFSVYVLVSKNKLRRQAERLIRVWLPEKIARLLIHTFDVGNEIFRNFVSGQTLEAFILGMLCMIGMLIFRIPYAPMVSVLVGVTALVPVVGAFVGTVVGAFMILTESPAKALVFVIFLLVLQQIEGNIIYPKMMSERVNLPAMWVLAAVTIGGGIAGPLGMLLGVPVFSTIYVLVKEATDFKEKKNREHVEVAVKEAVEKMNNDSSADKKTQAD